MASSSPSSLPSGKLDIRVIVEIPLRQFVPWLAMVLLVTWAGYPGVVCVTPVSWLLALRVGLVCVAHSASTQPGRRVQEASLAGGWFGLLHGILLWLVVPLLGEVKAYEQTPALVLSVVMLIVGMLAGAGLSAFTASLVERRRGAA
jgi:hypothetical protein